MKSVFVYELLSGGGLDGHDSVGKPLLSAGAAMRDAMVADLLALPDVSVTCAVASDVPPPSGGGRLKTCAPREGEAPQAFVRRCAAAHDCAWILAPETGGQLAALCDAVAPSRWLGCTRAAIELAASKRATARALACRGIAATQPWEAHAHAEADIEAWVVKPDDGAGATDTRVHRSLAAAAADYHARHQAAVLQPWVEGEALSLSLLCADDAAELLSINRQQIRVDGDGRLSYDGVTVNAIARGGRQGRELTRLAQRVSEAVPGLRGFAGIDVVWNPRRGPVVVEVNPRVTCAYVGLSASLGRNLARDVLRVFERRCHDPRLEVAA